MANTTITNMEGKNTMVGGNNMKSLATIVREFMEEFKGMDMSTIKQMAQEEYEAQKNAAQQPVEKKRSLELTDEEKENLYDWVWAEMDSKMRVSGKVMATLLYKYAIAYGKYAEDMAGYIIAFIDYFASENGEKDLKRAFKDGCALLAVNFGKSLTSDFDTLTHFLGFAETVVEGKTAWDVTWAIVHAHRYAKKSMDTAVEDILAYGETQATTKMIFDFIDAEDEEK